MPPSVDSLPIREDVPITPAPRAHGASLWPALCIYALFLTGLGLIIVGAFAPPETRGWSIPSNAWHKFR